MTDRAFAVCIFCKIFEVEEEQAQDDIYVPGVYDAVHMLSQREQTALECYWRDGMTLAQTGQKVGELNEEQTEHIINRAILRLRQPEIKRMMSISTMNMHYARQMQEKDHVIQNLRQRINELCIPQINFLNLSKRTYNALLRTGIEDFDALCALDWDELYRIRNVGKLGRQEIIDKMHQYGYQDWAKKMQDNNHDTKW